MSFATLTEVSPSEASASEAARGTSVASRTRNDPSSAFYCAIPERNQCGRLRANATVSLEAANAQFNPPAARAYTTVPPSSRTRTFVRLTLFRKDCCTDKCTFCYSGDCGTPPTQSPSVTTQPPSAPTAPTQAPSAPTAPTQAPSTPTQAPTAPPHHPHHHCPPHSGAHDSSGDYVLGPLRRVGESGRV